MVTAALGAVLIGAVAWTVVSGRQVDSFGIEADLGDPSTRVVAEAVQESLERSGFDATVYDTGQYDLVVEKVQDDLEPRGITIGVTARPVSSRQFPNVVSLGTVGEIPLLLLARADGAVLDSPAGLAGQRIQIGDAGSITADLAERVLAEYGITEANSTLQRDRADVAESMLRSGESDAMFAIDSPSGNEVQDVAADADLVIVPMPAARALAGRVGQIVAAELPRGSYGVAQDIPSDDVSIVAVPITVVARDGLSRSAVFAMSQALGEEFGQGTVLAEPGQFPTFLHDIPADPAAREYFETGVIPWQYRSLSPTLADLFLPLAFAGGLMLIGMSVFKFFMPDVFSVWTKVLRPRRAGRRATRTAGAATPEP